MNTKSAYIERQWTTRAGLEAMCVRVHYPEDAGGGPAYRCGYVRVTGQHPLRGVNHRLALKGRCGCRLADILDVHGGVTFSGEIRGLVGWWLGFDCIHAGDAPISDAILKEGLFRLPPGTTRTEDYVVEQCEWLARQVVSWPLRLPKTWRRSNG